jgi:hypothetical protein
LIWRIYYSSCSATPFVPARLLHLLADCVGVLSRHSYRHASSTCLLAVLAYCHGTRTGSASSPCLLAVLAYCHGIRTGTASSTSLLTVLPCRHDIRTGTASSTCLLTVKQFPDLSTHHSYRHGILYALTRGAVLPRHPYQHVSLLSENLA